MNETLKLKIQQKTRESFDIAERRFGRKFPKVKLVVKDLDARLAGRAWSSPEWKIELNERFLYTEAEHILTSTIPHEVAHIVTDVLYPRAKSHHGPEWQFVMTEMGQKPDIYHQCGKQTFVKLLNGLDY